MSFCARNWNSGIWDSSAAISAARASSLERHRLVDQLDLGGLARWRGRPVSACHLALARLNRYIHMPVR